MSVIAAALKHMLAANMPHDAILAAVEDMERGLQTDEQAERRRASDRERQREKRLRMSAESADKSDGPRAGVTRVEDKTLTSEIEPQVSKKQTAPSRDVDGFVSELSSDVPSDLLAEFVKVRRKKRGALTAYAAKLFRDDAAGVSMSVADAAKECVRSSWITVKPEYFGNRQRAGPTQKPNPGLDAAKALMEKLDAAAPSQSEANQPYPRLVAFSGG